MTMEASIFEKYCKELDDSDNDEINFRIKIMKYDYELKILPEYFGQVVTGKKTFEIRATDDKTFKVGDRVLLKEWDKYKQRLTGRYVVVEITYVTDFNQPVSQVVFSHKTVTDFFNPHMDYDEDYKKLKIV